MRASHNVRAGQRAGEAADCLKITPNGPTRGAAPVTTMLLQNEALRKSTPPRKSSARYLRGLQRVEATGLG